MGFLRGFSNNSMCILFRFSWGLSLVPEHKVEAKWKRSHIGPSCGLVLAVANKWQMTGTQASAWRVCLLVQEERHREILCMVWTMVGALLSVFFLLTGSAQC